MLTCGEKNSSQQKQQHQSFQKKLKHYLSLLELHALYRLNKAHTLTTSFRCSGRQICYFFMLDRVRLALCMASRLSC